VNPTTSRKNVNHLFHIKRDITGKAAPGDLEDDLGGIESGRERPYD